MYRLLNQCIHISRQFKFIAIFILPLITQNICSFIAFILKSLNFSHDAVLFVAT